MDIFVEWFHKECDEIHEEDIKVVFSGRKDNLRPDVLEAMETITERTKDNKKGIFNICLNYGGQQEIVDATKRIAEEVKEGKLAIEDINTETMYKYMYQELPPVDFMIRTSGEERVSNFLLYEISYAEMYFPKVKFPDFNEEEFEKAIDIYNQRDRILGGNTK
jgi:undecaprenyl diphosphate synthase